MVESSSSSSRTVDVASGRENLDEIGQLDMRAVAEADRLSRLRVKQGSNLTYRELKQSNFQVYSLKRHQRRQKVAIVCLCVCVWMWPLPLRFALAGSRRSSGGDGLLKPDAGGNADADKFSAGLVR